MKIFYVTFYVKTIPSEFITRVKSSFNRKILFSLHHLEEGKKKSVSLKKMRAGCDRGIEKKKKTRRYGVFA